MSIKSKLVLNAVFGIACLVVIGGVGFFFTDRVAKVSMSIVETKALPIIYLDDVEKNMFEIMIHLTNHAAVSDSEKMAELDKKIQEHHTRIVADLAKYHELAGSETEDDLLIFRQEWEKFKSLEKTVLEYSNEYAKEDALSILTGEGKTLFEKAKIAIEKQEADLKIQMETLRDRAINARENSVIWIVALTAVAGMVLMIVGLGFMKSISAPVALVMNGLKDIAEGEGDLTMRLGLKRKDEIGQLAGWFDSFVQNLQVIIRGIADNIVTLNSSSEGLSVLSGTLSSASKETNTQADNVAGAAEQLSANINGMAASAEEMSVNAQNVSSSAEQMSQNMNSIASSMEEMSMAIREVSGNSREGMEIANKAGEMSDSATQTMEALGGAAKEIGDVTAMIKRIAEQTNLLALNATIEAASAGDAGKGFAVVANEIKELANQSAGAAEDITKRIEGVQANTEEAIKVIADVSVIIDKINEFSLMITKSVEQQTTTANEISGNVQQANSGVNNIAAAIAEIAKGSNDMAKSSGEAASGVNEVSSNILGVSKAAGDTDSAARQVSTSADALAGVAASLQERVGKFKVNET